MAHYEDDIYVHGLHGQSRDNEMQVDYLGHQEILGREEILGALGLSTQQLKGGPTFQQALANKLARRAPVVQKVQPTKKRRYVMGFGPTTIPPSSTVTISAQPQVLFRGEKLINTGDSNNLFIAGMFVGNLPQLPTFGNQISVSTFAGTVLDNEMLFDTCDPALNVTFQVQNVSSTTTQTWSMSLVGHIVQAG